LLSLLQLFAPAVILSAAKDPLLLLQLSVLVVILSEAKDPDEPHFI
jgi:hypothetical protein